MSRAEPVVTSDRSFISRSFETWNRVATSIPRTAALSMVGPAILIVLGYVLWIQYGASSLDHSLYGLKAQNITLTPRPPWIHADINEEVYLGSRLERISLLDREASSTIAAAFDNHPWIARVLRVQKMAGSQVKIDVEYRRPFAWVHHERHVDSNASIETDAVTKSTGEVVAEPRVVDLYYIVDSEGVNLPRKDFVWDDLAKYFQIYCPGAEPPTGPVGSPYTDPRILKALQVCGVLEESRAMLELERINVKAENQSSVKQQWVFEIQLKDGRSVYWGHAPGEEVAGEPNAKNKLADLRRQLQSQNVSLPSS